MPVYSIAGISVEYECTYPLLYERSRKYLSSSPCDNAEKIEVTDKYYEVSRRLFPHLNDEYAEYSGMGISFSKLLLKHDGIVLHASAVAYQNRAYLFSAPSGTGKSTHVRLWQKLFSEAQIVNDDKPAIKKVGDTFFAFGTPFSGKNDISINGGFEIAGICFFERAKENTIRRMTKEEALSPIFNQTLRPGEDDKMDLLCSVIDEIVDRIPIYRMGCNEDISAAQMSFNAMSGGKT